MKTLLIIVTIYFSLLLHRISAQNQTQLRNFFGKAVKRVTSGVERAASKIPDSQKVLTFFPRAFSETRQNIDKKLVSQDSQDVRFLLFEDKHNLDIFTQIRIGDSESVFERTMFDHQKPLKILIHGFKQTYTGRFPQIIKDAYVEHTDYNVVVVDWGALSKPRVKAGQLVSVLYPLVVDNVPRVGERVADFIIYLRANDFISSLNTVHLIGFSLGAHVAAIAGESVKRRMGGYKVGRITGLDPAGPKFLTAHRERRLDRDDASFVDVIHTSSLGYASDIGHADFFPNGGIKQPKCADADVNLFQTISSLGNALVESCNHFRAVEFFNRSITDDIYSCKCSSWTDYRVSCKRSCQSIVQFGEPCPPEARGSFYMDIAD